MRYSRERVRLPSLGKLGAGAGGVFSAAALSGGHRGSSAAVCERRARLSAPRARRATARMEQGGERGRGEDGRGGGREGEGGGGGPGTPP